MLGFITRLTRNFNNIKCIRLLYFAYVRSQLEYNSPVWNPYYNIHVQAVERIQNKFLRFINFKMGIPANMLNYNNILNVMNMLKLSDRRIFADLVFLYKILNDLVDSPVLLELISFRIPLRNTRSQDLFQCRNSGTNYHMYSSLPRILMEGNNYAKSVDIFNLSLNKFKVLLLKQFSYVQ